MSVAPYRRNDPALTSIQRDTLRLLLTGRRPISAPFETNGNINPSTARNLIRRGFAIECAPRVLSITTAGVETLRARPK